MKFSVAARTSAGLSILFLIVYGGCNWFTAQRTDVGTLYFEWERHIPFVPWMIVPYMSIDLFFVAAPFLCRDRVELKTFSRRVTLAVVVAGACFLLFPLRFAFERPGASGWLGVVFDWFRSMDHPFNLLPSLHITLRTILADTFVRHTKGVLRAGTHVWFSLIGLSTLLTYQHHVLDVVGGFALACVCFHTVRERTTRLPVCPNRRIGLYYGIAAFSAIIIAATFRSWGLWLLWPALSTSIVCTAYLGVGPGIFRKNEGRLPLSTMLVLAPVLIGQWLSLLHYRRQCRPWDEVVSGVWIGGKLSDNEAAEAIQLGVTAVLDLTVEFTEAKPFTAIRYHNLPILDLTKPNQEQLETMVRFLTDESARGIVYVHCKIGYSRSAAAVAAFLLSSGKVTTPEQAFEMLRRVRPSVVIRPEIHAALDTFSADRP